MPISERMSTVTSLSLIGLVLYFLLDFPTQPTSVTMLGTPLGLESPRRWLMIALLIAVAMAGADSIIRAHPSLVDRRLSYLTTFWMLPGVLMVAAVQLLSLAPSAGWWLVGLLAVGIALWLTLTVEYEQVVTTTRWHTIWRQVIGFGVALLLFTVIYQMRARSLLSATEMMLVSGAISLALLRQSPQAIIRTWLFAAVIALSMGQLIWTLNYWRIDTISAGLLLFLVFYVLVGLASQHLTARLSPRSMWEFGTVSILVLVAIFAL